MTAKLSTIEWMHPSWRDLVINHLASNAAARQKFLSRCGVQGFLLALSSAGGVKGERNTPLLVEPQDWEALKKSLPIVLGSEFNAPWQVLTAVQEAILAGNASKDDVKKGLLLELAEELLKTLRARWEAAPGECSVSLLSRYYQVSEFCWPLPPSPDLPSIWDAYVATAKEEVASSDPEDEKTSYEELIDWIDLAETLATYEPRFLRRIGFPENYLSLFNVLLPQVQTRVTYQFEFETEDDCSDEEYLLENLESMAWAIAKLVPSIAEMAKDIARSASSKENKVADLRRELEKSEKEAHRTSAVISTSSSADSVESVNIAELFRDL